MNSILAGFGSFLPQKVLTNNDLSKFLDTSDEWIRQRTGIGRRCIVEDGETTSDLATKAASVALSDAGINAEDVDLIVVGTVTPDFTFPSVANIVQKKLGIKNHCATFDLSAACSGFVYALDVADSYIKLGKAKNALVIGAETFSKILDWKDRSSCILFGDGAGAVVLKAEENSQKGVIATKIFSDGSYSDYLKTSGGVSTTQTSGTIQMMGREVFRCAVELMKSAIEDVLREKGFSLSDIDLLVPHQANLRIISSLANSLDLPMEKVLVTVDEHANTCAASIPLALAKNKSKLEGKNIMLVSMGAGFTWGASFIKM